MTVPTDAWRNASPCGEVPDERGCTDDVEAWELLEQVAARVEDVQVAVVATEQDVLDPVEIHVRSGGHGVDRGTGRERPARGYDGPVPCDGSQAVPAGHRQHGLELPVVLEVDEDLTTPLVRARPV